MGTEGKSPQKVKSRLHGRNKHRSRYDLKDLVTHSPELASHVIKNAYGDESVDFFNPMSVLALNKALLLKHYGVNDWDIPQGYLCPPIPGRADYIHHVADLLCSSNFGTIPTGSKITVLDIGVGANCVYPIIGNAEYGWNFIGSDVDPAAIDSAKAILKKNPGLKKSVDLRMQKSAKQIFTGVLQNDEHIDVAICNPPFHGSKEEAQLTAKRKFKNLAKDKKAEMELNFGGKSFELWCEGGEKAFVQRMANESKKFRKSCFWFTTLVSKQSNLKGIHKILETLNAEEVMTLPMGQGNKSSRIVAWTFLTKEERKAWKTGNWQKK
jgi:23S rRNA (adenine1618-N6)-methyltransferase